MFLNYHARKDRNIKTFFAKDHFHFKCVSVIKIKFEIRYYFAFARLKLSLGFLILNGQFESAVGIQRQSEQDDLKNYLCKFRRIRVDM